MGQMTMGTSCTSGIKHTMLYRHLLSVGGTLTHQAAPIAFHCLQNNAPGSKNQQRSSQLKATASYTT